MNHAPLNAQRTGAIVALLATSGCNLVLGLEDHEDFGDNCGAESLNARIAFANEDTGHCYALVRSDEEDGTDFSMAKASCAQAGGYLACVNDQTELELIGQRVATRAWLGMHAQTNTELRFSCITGERFEADYPAWAEGHPRPDMGGGNCTFVNNGLVESASCNGQLDNWLCELAPSTTAE